MTPRPEDGFQPIIDPRAGDAEDDASSTKSHGLTQLAGSMLAEISLPKLLLSWLLMIGIPGLSLGLTPLVGSAWLKTVTNKVAVLSGLGSIVLLLVLLAIAWHGAGPLLRYMERSFWSLHGLAVQPGYAFCREALSHVSERFLDAGADEHARSRRRAKMAALAGLVTAGIAAGVVMLAWPHTRWSATWAMLSTPVQLIVPALANAVVIVGAYLAVASIVWGVADCLMDQPERLGDFATPTTGREWRIAHLSDIHAVGERYGFRIESGRTGPQGNERLTAVLDRLEEAHRTKPIDAIVVSGDMTDAGRSSEWAEFLERLMAHPRLAERTLMLPGNHDVNVVDRANPARLELPISPGKRLRQMRTLSAMELVQGHRAHICDRSTWRIGPTLSAALAPHRDEMAAFADAGHFSRSGKLGRLWTKCFPQVIPPADARGIGFIILNSNAESNFSFTNALGLVATEDVQIVRAVAGQYPEAGWIIALHHHLIEYPMAVKAFSERIGTALINGSWFVRLLKPLANRVVVMHGHRHIDWIGRMGALKIVSAPSPVMDARDADTTHFYIHALSVGPGGSVSLAAPERIEVPGALAPHAHPH